MKDPLSNYRGNLRFWLKSYLFLGVAVLILGVLLYSNFVIQRMREQSEASTELFSRFIAEVVLQSQDSGKAAIVQDVLEQVRLPLILTDIDGRPFAWHRVGIAAPDDEDFDLLLSIDPKNPPPGKIADLIEKSAELDHLNDPIPLRAGANAPIQGYVHFGRSSLERQLQFMPFIQLALFLVFMGVGLQGFRYLKLSEHRSIWVGMAKETAHQLGTPLSALLGWTQLIKDQASERDIDRMQTSIAEMEEDLKRLSKVADRFSKIGSRPELANIRIDPVLERTVSYFHKRLPRLKANSAITTSFEETPLIRGNEELLEWVFENLIKNGLDAMGDKGGTIHIETRFDSAHKRIDVLVKDTGKGVPAALRARIFSPGFTTKERGWGLGLALTRRIVVDYHGGEIKLAESQIGKGSTFLVRFPVA